MLNLLDEHGDAVEYDLICLGLRLRHLGTKRLTWRDLKVIIQQQPASSALFRAMNPEEHHWTLGNQLIAAAIDALHTANWQRAGDPKAPRPRPTPRPGVESPDTRYGGKGDAVPLEQMAEWLGWN